MQPNNNMVNNTAPAPAPTPMTTPMNPGGDIVFKDKPKKKTGMIIGMVVLALLATGGIGFGVWAYLDGNARVAKKDEQISNLQNQLAEQPEEEEIIIDEDTDGDINPVIKSSVDNETMSIRFESSTVWSDGDAKVVEIGINDGSVNYCNISNKQWLGNGGSSLQKISDCSISGLSGSIYDVIEFGAGQDNSGNNIGFIMTDGTVKYLPLYDSVMNNNFAARGALGIDGSVTNAIQVDVSLTDSPVGGYVSTVFVLSDGSIVKYNESML